MIEPLARGVDPVQLAFQSLVSVGTRAQRTESPLAVALGRLGVDLARGESFTTAEAKQFVGLVQATLEVFASAVPAAPPAQGAAAIPEPAVPAQGTGVLLETAQFAMRDLQRALTQVLTEHRQVTTGLAPILRQLLVAMQVETLAPEARPVGTAGLLPVLENPGRAVDVHAPPPTLASVVSALVESIARLQAVLPLDAVLSAEGLIALEHTGATVGTPQTPAGAAAAVPRTAALSPGTARLLQALVEAFADLLALLPVPGGSMPVKHPSAALPEPTAQTASTAQSLQNLAGALGEAVALLHDVLLVTPAPAASEQPHAARQPAPATVPGQSAPPPSGDTLGTAAAQVLRLVHALLIPQPPPAEADPSHVAIPQSSAPRLAEMSGASATRLVESLPPVAASLPQLPPILVASLTAVVANLKGSLPPALAASLVTATLLAELEAATVLNPAATSIPASTLATVDAYRWGLLVGLNYRPALGRPAQTRISTARPRCETCSRLLVQSRSGALVCPTC